MTISAGCEDLGDTVGTTICRIVQEALGNAVRHAEPKVVRIEIERRSDPQLRRDEVRLAVEDDGKGLREADKLGYGLVGISERVRAIGGRLSFCNKSGEGFAVVAALPCPTAAEQNLRKAEAVEP